MMIFNYLFICHIVPNLLQHLYTSHFSELRRLLESWEPITQSDELLVYCLRTLRHEGACFSLCGAQRTRSE